LNLQDYAKVLRKRWVTVCVTAMLVVLDALAFTLATPPQYQASTQLFVSASSGPAWDLYQGNRLSQERLLTYTDLIMGRTLAQRTVDHHNLDISAESLRAKVKATAQRNTVLINVSVVDASPTRARELANAVSDEFVLMAAEFEPPSSGKTGPDTRVVVTHRASIPTKPSNSGKRLLLLGLAAGVALGVGLAIAREQMDNAVKDRESLEAITGVGLVGSIPLARELRNSNVISFEGNNSSVAESFRRLRTNLQFLHVDNPPRVIVITSASPGEGKSTTAINIALALAEAGHDVVLVDGDLRRPSIEKRLDTVGGVGFSTVLNGAATLPEVLQQTAFPNLTALTSGASPPNPSELLGSQAAKNVLNELRERFDFVIVDSSPLLGVTDGAILSANADGALIVCRYGRTKRENLAHAIGNLTDVGATVLGGVFTITPTRSRISYSYSHRFYYDDRREPVA
jgi:receptor protein-tyrosine kinase